MQVIEFRGSQEVDQRHRQPVHVQDNRVVKVTSPIDSSVTEGHLCIKGRFGFEFVQRLPRG